MVREFCVKHVNGSSRVLREQLCEFQGCVNFLQDILKTALFLFNFPGHSNRSRFSHTSHTRFHAHRSSFSHKIHTRNLRRRRPFFTQAWAGRPPAPTRPPPTHTAQPIECLNSWSPGPTPASDTLAPAALPHVSSVRVPAASPRGQNPCRLQSFSTGLVQEPKPCNSLAIPGPCPIALQTSD